MRTIVFSLSVALALTTTACVEQPDAGPDAPTLSDDLDLAARESYTLDQSASLATDEPDEALARSIICSESGDICCTDNLSLCCIFFPGQPAICF